MRNRSVAMSDESLPKFADAVKDILLVGQRKRRLDLLVQELKEPGKGFHRGRCAQVNYFNIGCLDRFLFFFNVNKTSEEIQDALSEIQDRMTEGCFPDQITSNSYLYTVENESNIVVLGGVLQNKQIFDFVIPANR